MKSAHMIDRLDNMCDIRKNPLRMARTFDGKMMANGVKKMAQSVGVLF